MRIPPEKIDQVRSSTDIVDLIGGFVRLKKVGKNYVGLCPFHGEKTPSFNVSPDRQMYHCFGCGAGGNAISFVMEYEKVSFVEAVRSLAEKAGIPIPTQVPEAEAAASEQEELYNVCREAARFFHRLLTESQEGKLAFEYFRTVRCFSDDTIRTFGLGYAPNSWDGLLKEFVERKFQPALLEKAGLVRRREDGSYYDTFRGRAIFPILSATGRVVGFGARKLREDDPIAGKYINSPETLIYNKSKILYGLFQSKDAIRESGFVILVEGYADLITVYQGGVRNVVATSGTALTIEQIQLINRYTKNVSIVYDADSAGSKAAMRSVDAILESDLDVRVVSLPQGDDPDSFVKKHGGDAFRKIVDGSVSFVDFVAQQFEREGDVRSPEGQARVVRSIVQTIGKMSDELKRNFYIKHVAEKYDLSELSLYRELEKHVAKPKGYRTSVNFLPTAGERELKEIRPAKTEVPNVERDLLHAMIEGGESVVRFIFEQIPLEMLTHPHSRAVAKQILNRVEEGAALDASSLIDDLEDPDQRRILADAIFSKYQLSKRWQEASINVVTPDPLRMAADAIAMIRRRSLEAMMEENQKELRMAARRGDDVVAFLERNKQLLDAIKQLEKRNSPKEGENTM